MALIPNFFVIGAPKAGTTSLYSQLSRHPDIFLSPIKEPNHFCTDLHALAGSSSLNDRLPLDIENYLSSQNRKAIQSAWITDRSLYCRLFENAGSRPAIGECSTTYMYSEVAAKRILAFCPHAKVIAVLRSPADRAFSHYMMDRRIGITSKTFREELLLEARHPNADWGNSRLYLALGRYSEQLARFYDCFPRDQIMVFGSDELRNQEQSVLDRVFRFLAVRPQDESISPVSDNTAALARFPFVNKVLHKTRLKRGLRSALPSSLKKWLRQHYFVDASTEILDPLDRKLVDELMSAETAKLATLLAGNRPPWLEEWQTRVRVTPDTGRDSWR
jgi:hypothetical protein